MSNSGRMTTNLLLLSRREDDWRRADEWRRLHARPEVAPMPADETKPLGRFATILRLIPRHA